VESSTPFADWVRQHQKNWKPNSAEWEERMAIFTQTVMDIKKHNSNPNKAYTLGLNKFSASTKAEMKVLSGAVPEMSKHHSPKTIHSQDIIMKSVKDLPTSVDWREAGVMSPVKDQGHCGSCWAFSATETLESHVAISTGILFSLSPQQIASCTDNVDQCGGTGGCSGGMPQVAFDSIANSQHGITTEFEYSYNSYYGDDLACKTLSDQSDTPTAVAEVDGYVQVAPNNYTELMNAVAQVGPVAIVLDASTFRSYEGGIFDGCDYENIELDHAVQLVGYGECPEHGPYWLVRNSWGPGK
jgi:cathepsin L